MENKNKSFILYTEFYEVMKDLTDAQIGKLHRAIYIYQLEGKVIDLDPTLAMAFKFVKIQLDKNQTKWEEEKIKRSEAGKKGMQSRWSKEGITNDNKDNKCYKPITNIRTITPITDNVNVDVNVDVNNKKEKSKKEKDSQTQQLSAPAIVPSKVKPLNSQQRVYEYFASKYKKLTGIKYLSKRSEFINLADLIRTYGEEMVCQKIEWLEIGCKNAVFWFAKEINDFTIGTLVKHWNNIIPKLTEEQKKKQEEERKEKERMERVLAEVQRRKEEEKKWISH